MSWNFDKDMYDYTLYIRKYYDKYYVIDKYIYYYI